MVNFVLPNGPVLVTANHPNALLDFVGSMLRALGGLPVYRSAAAGFVALAWRERWVPVRDDVLLFFRALARPQTTGRLAHYREQLVREFDTIDAEMDAAAAAS